MIREGFVVVRNRELNLGSERLEVLLAAVDLRQLRWPKRVSEQATFRLDDEI